MTRGRRLGFLCLWAGANVIGVGAYLSFASTLWTRPGEESGQSNLSNAFYWLSHSVPILVLFLVANVFAVMALRRSKNKSAARTATMYFRIFAAVWLLVVLFDWIKSQ